MRQDAVSWGRRYVMVRARPLPGRLRDQPVHGPRRPARPGARAGAVAGARRRDRAPPAAPSRSSRSAPDAPDMVYAMNLGLGRSTARDGGDRTSCSRTCATPSAGWRPRRPQPWFARHGFAPRRTSAATASAPTSRPATCSRWRGDAGRGLRPAHRGARAQAPGHRPRRPGARACGSPTRACTTSTSPSARSTTARAMVCPAAFDDASAPRAAGPGARAAGAHRGGGADTSAPTRSWSAAPS